MCGRKQAYILVGLFIGVLVFLPMSGPVIAQSQKIGDPPEFSNMRLVGFSDLQGRSAYQPTIHHQGNRWIIYNSRRHRSYWPLNWITLDYDWP